MAAKPKKPKMPGMQVMIIPANVAAVELIVEAQDEAHGERIVAGLTGRGMRTIRRNV